MTGLEVFEDLASYMFSVADQRGRSFRVSILPEDHLSLPDLECLDSYQLVVAMEIER